MQKLSLLADLVDIHQQLETDQALSREQLKLRDRQIGLSVPKNLATADSTRLRYWINTLRQQNADESPPTKLPGGTAVQRSIRTIVGILWLIGGGCGWVLGRAVLHYDGSAPVNIISTLLILVGLQSLTLVALMVLSAGGFSRLQESLSIINPARLVALVSARLSPRWREQLQQLTTQSGIAGRGIERRLLVYMSQHFTVALNIGIIAALMFLVMVSDLAFGWNTTLNLENTQAARWFQTVAIPWQGLMPEAVPDISLVESSRYYRLEGQLRSGNWSAAKLGTWWLYLLLAVVTYGLLPRLGALVLTGVGYDRALLRAMETLPGASQVVARMQAPLVSTVADQAETENDDHDAAMPLHRRQSAAAIDALVVEWSGATANKSDLRQSGIEPQQIFAAGGHQSLAEDRNITAHIAEHRPQGVVIVVRAWEPPMLDFNDFIQSLREQLPPGCPLIVMLAAMERQKVTTEQLRAWETAVYSLRDSALYVETL